MSICPSSRTASCGVENRHADDVLPACSRRHNADHIRHVVTHQTRLRPTFASSKTMHCVLLARISQLNDDADRLLVETLEAAFALQVFQMTSDRPFAAELLRLLVRQEPSLP